MGKTKTHKIEAKFRNDLIEYEKIPENIKQKFNRHNFEKGYFKNLRNKKRYETIQQY